MVYARQQGGLDRLAFSLAKTAIKRVRSMSYWPARLEITAEQFDSKPSDALLERIGPWLLGALESEASCPPEPIRLAGSVYWLWGEIANGGLAQYFTNGALGYVYANHALGKLDRKNVFKYLEEAKLLLPSDFYSQNLTERWDKSSADNAISALDRPLWESLRDDTIFDDLAAYVRSHRREFEPYFSG
jgi:hypothetical protein